MPSGSASGSLSLSYESEDPDPHPDPYQNVTIRNTVSKLLTRGNEKKIKGQLHDIVLVKEFSVLIRC